MNDRAAFNGSRCLEIPTLDFPNVTPSQTTRSVLNDVIYLYFIYIKKFTYKKNVK